MSTGAFPEPRAFSIRADRFMREHGHNYDVIHDNQCLGTGMVRIAQRQPLLATVHHPITVDKTLGAGRDPQPLASDHEAALVLVLEDAEARPP